MKSTNYKVMICYNLVFNFKIFCHNYGSILTLILFIVYLCFMIYAIFRGLAPIKINVSKLIFEEDKLNNLNKSNLLKYSRKSLKSKLNLKEKEEKNGHNPPKKGQVRKSKIETNNLVTEKMEFVETPKNDRDKKRKISKVKPSAKTLLADVNNIEITKADKEKRNNVDGTKDDSNQKNLDNFELNNLEFKDACKLDKRTFCKTYWSVLMREHVALLTFFAWKDYNLFYIKFDKFLILFCTDMTMNGLFFVHESMHKKYTDNEDSSFVDKIPQLLFSLLVSHAMEVILCFLSMTDKHIYEIKALPKLEQNDQLMFDIVDKIRKKLIAFFVFTFLVFLFHWYFISAFCAVYQNTQVIFLRDSGISILTSLIDPFLIYGATTLLRYFSLLKCCKKKACCLYKVSDIFPLF